MSGDYGTRNITKSGTTGGYWIGNVEPMFDSLLPLMKEVGKFVNDTMFTNISRYANFYAIFEDMKNLIKQIYQDVFSLYTIYYQKGLHHISEGILDGPELNKIKHSFLSILHKIVPKLDKLLSIFYYRYADWFSTTNFTTMSVEELQTFETILQVLFSFLDNILYQTLSSIPLFHTYFNTFMEQLSSADPKHSEQEDDDFIPFYHKQLEKFKYYSNRLVLSINDFQQLVQTTYLYIFEKRISIVGSRTISSTVNILFQKFSNAIQNICQNLKGILDICSRLPVFFLIPSEPETDKDDDDDDDCKCEEEDDDKKSDHEESVKEECECEDDGKKSDHEESVKEECECEDDDKGSSDSSDSSGSDTINESETSIRESCDNEDRHDDRDGRHDRKDNRNDDRHDRHEKHGRHDKEDDRHGRHDREDKEDGRHEKHDRHGRDDDDVYVVSSSSTVSVNMKDEKRMERLVFFSKKSEEDKEKEDHQKTKIRCIPKKMLSVIEKQIRSNFSDVTIDEPIAIHNTEGVLIGYVLIEEDTTTVAYVSNI